MECSSRDGHFDVVLWQTDFRHSTSVCCRRLLTPAEMNAVREHGYHRSPTTLLSLSCFGLRELCGVLLTDVLVFQVMNVTATINWP